MKTTENFYCQDVVQVHTNIWYKDRVILLGDAGYCPSPFSGMETTSSLVGAYVLAGEINRNTENLDQALENYDKTLRPFVNEIQKTSLFLLRQGLPMIQWGFSIC